MTIAKIPLFLVFLRLFFFFGALNFSTNYYLFLFCGLLSLVFGVFSPFAETRLLRVFLYSSLYVNGYCILVLLNPGFFSLLVSLFFFFSYTFLFFFFFNQFFFLPSTLRTRNLAYNSDLAFFISKSSFLLFFSYLFFFSMSALPPMILF
jgi:NADH:ubiquinone oxidoreductase subunit 2 (subunit N)